jgi:hypothetical protein
VPPLSVDLAWILEVARRAGHQDAAPDDFGVPLAACYRHQVALMDRDIYSGPVNRAAALAHTLGRLQWLERSNMTVAIAVTVAYLRASGRDVKPGKEEIGALVDELRRDECTAASTATVLRSWPAEH